MIDNKKHKAQSLVRLNLWEGKNYMMAWHNKSYNKRQNILHCLD